MPLPIPTTPTPALLRRLAVGRLVSHAHAMRWADELDHLLGYGLPSVASVRLPDHNGSANCTVFYKPSAYCKALRIAVEVYGDSNATLTVGVSLGSDWITNQANSLDGTTVRLGPATRPARLLVGYYDVSTLTPGNTYELTVTHVASSGNSGLRRVNVCEVPLAATDVQTTPASEPSFNPAWALPPGKLVEGTSSLAYGFARIMGELAKARDEVPRHLQLAVRESTGGAEIDSSGAYVAIFGGTNALYRCRVRRLYTAADGERVRVAVRYQAVSGATLRIVATPVGGASVNVDVPLPASAASFVTDTGTTFDLDATGTGGEIDLAFQLKATSGTAYVSTVALLGEA